MEIQKLLQNKFANANFNEIKEILANKYDLVVKEDTDNPELYLITLKKNEILEKTLGLKKNHEQGQGKDQSPNENVEPQPFLEECHGIILEKNTNKVICYTFGVGQEYDYDTNDDDANLEDYGLQWDNSQVEQSIEGTQLRLYQYQGKWIVSTVRCIDAKRAFWHSQKSFADLFQEAVQAQNWEMEGKLTPGHCYALVLQHPENQIVIKYQTPQLIHVLSRDLSQKGFPEIDEEIGLPKPKRFEANYFSNFQDLLKQVKSYQKMDIEGFIIKSLDTSNSKRLKIMAEFYRRVKDLRGNITRGNFIYQYLILKKNNQIQEYLNYFPEDGKFFRRMENKLQDLIAEIHKQYCKKFVNKEITMKDVFFQFRPFIYEINGIHLESRMVINKKKVADEFYKRDPAQMSFIYKSFYDEKKPNKYKTSSVPSVPSTLSSTGEEITNSQTDSN